MAAPVIIGGGLAGLTVALAMAPRPVVLFARRGGVRLTSSELAQGGLAVAMGADDSIEDHVRDTLAAGAGQCDETAVRSIVGDGPRAVEQLVDWGVVFDREAGGALRLGLEGAHSHRRVAHARGDATGAQIMQTLLQRVRATPSIHLIEGAQVLRLLTDDAGVCGVLFAQDGQTQVQSLPTRQVVLATGSACALWREASVPLSSWGQGLALAREAGASFADLEFVQFHPTALDAGEDPLPLITEALRGEGAKLLNAEGLRFVAELAPRDVVARAICEQRKTGGVFLDARAIADFEKRFPTIAGICARAHIDPARQPLPVRPAAHYHMGGVVTDLAGRTIVDGLWACGEVARTGLHGANRLASNSLLEGLVMGLRIAPQLGQGQGQGQGASVAAERCNEARPPEETPEVMRSVRAIMMDAVGLSRSAEGLGQAIAALEPLAATSLRAATGLMIARAALAREKSCGAHYRADEMKVGVEER